MKLDKMREALEILNKVRSYEKSLKALEDYDPNEMLKEASVSLGKIGSAASSAGKQEKQVTIETIDWVQRKSDALKDQHDLLSKLAEDETASYDKRVDALTQLIEMDNERANTARRSAQACRESWKEAIKDLQNFLGQRETNAPISIIEYQTLDTGFPSPLYRLPPFGHPRFSLS